VHAGDPIVEVSAVPEDSTLVFTMDHRESGETGEAILLSSEDDVTAWRNCCQHQRHVPLDPGDGAVLREGELVCTRHGATFGAEDGHCTYGPCAGASLETVEVSVEDGTVYLVDEDWSFQELGSAATDPSDRSTTNAPGF
jgi:nitrite reductase/ring-hydroxylating ferredoxin subunit